MDLIQDQIMSQVAWTPNAMSSTIGMAVRKELLQKGLLDKDADSRNLIETKLAQVFDKWMKLRINTIQNLIVEARRFCG